MSNRARDMSRHRAAECCHLSRIAREFCAQREVYIRCCLSDVGDVDLAFQVAGVEDRESPRARSIRRATTRNEQLVKALMLELGLNER